MKENENIERGENSITQKHIVHKNANQTAIENALSQDLQINQTRLAHLEASTVAIPGQTEKQTAATAAAVQSIQDNLQNLDTLQHQVRADRTRSDSEKLFILNKNSQAGYETIAAKFALLRTENTARFNQAKSQLFSTTAGNLSALELSMLPQVAAALNKPNGALLTSTPEETKTTLYLLSKYPGLVTSKTIDPSQDAAGLTKDADERFSKEAFDTVQNSLQIEEAANAFELSIATNKAALLPEELIKFLHEQRV